MTPDDERAMLQVIDERDATQDWADRLAAAIAPQWVRGEHSNANDPWRNALDYFEGQLRDRSLSSVLEEADGYTTLRDHIIDELNPSDDDLAEVGIMVTAISRAVEFIQAQPCTCPSGAYDNYDRPCDRCWALGRREDKRVES